MDNVTLIRVVAGVLAVVVLLILVFRMKKKSSSLGRGLTCSGQSENSRPEKMAHSLQGEMGLNA